MATESLIDTGNLSLAEDVRSIALDVRRLVRAGGGHPDEIAAISRRIGRVRDHVSALPPSSLHRWLDGLDRELDDL